MILSRIPFAGPPGLTINQQAVGTALDGGCSGALSGPGAALCTNVLFSTSIAVLDSHSQGGGQTDSRTLIGVLAYYYLLADPDHTFLMFFGGQDPNGTWAKHWTPAVSFDVGKPEGKWSEFATGTDPANKDLTYKVLQRPYSNGLILYRPLSHVRGNRAAPVLGDESAIKQELKGTYKPLQADGTLGAPVTSISLRNGEGAILIKAK